MAVRNLLFKPAGAAAALCLAAGMALLGAGPAQATATASGAPTRSTQSGTSTLITFHKTGASRFAPMTTFGCTVSYPYVTDTFLTGEISWTAQVSCNYSLRMQGTTVLYQWGSNSAYAFGSSYNNTASVNNSSGAVYGIHSGTWGVNDNVEIFPPSGFTTTLGGGCYYVNGSPSDIHCTITTGPINAG